MTDNRTETAKKFLAKDLHEKFNELRDSSWVELARMQWQQIEMLDRLAPADRARMP